nr:hypothetical protein ABEDB_3543 [Acinetobacter lwoffii]
MKMKILILCFISVFIAACSNEAEHSNTDEKTQKDWADRNKSNIDFEKHESKGF